MSIMSRKSRKNYGKISDTLDISGIAGEIRYSDNTGLQTKLNSGLRTTTLKEIAKQRGDRIRTIREKLNKTLEEMAKIFHIQSGNYGRMERGEVCMSRSVAYWISRTLLDLGIIATTTWLLSGKGPSPQVIINEPLKLYDYLKEKFELNIQKSEIGKEEQDALLINSMIIYLYQKANPNSLLTYVKDTKMEPSFYKGNIVGGRIVSEENYNELHGKDCIVVCGVHTFVRCVLIVDNQFILISTDKNDTKIFDHITQAAIINFRICADISNESNVAVPGYNDIIFDVYSHNDNL